MAKKKELITYDIKCGFNDFCMRELKLDITDDDKVYYMDTNEILKYNDKFLKYPEVVEYLRSISPVWEALSKGETPHLI